MAHVAFLGTGLLGTAMVERIIEHGHAVTVWNRTPDKARGLERAGASVAATVEEAVVGAGRVHLAVTDDEVVDALLDRILPHLVSKAVVIDHSTTSPAGTRRRHSRMVRAGARFLHAPVFMSPPMARSGKGLMMVSGDAGLFEEVRPALAEMTGDVWYLGADAERAAAFKLFGNSMIFVIVSGLSDVLAMAKGVGIPFEDAVALFGRFQPGVAIPMRAEKMARGDFSPMFELAMARKDVRLMMEAAAGQPLAVIPAIAARMDAAIGRGHGADDLVAVAAEVVRD